MSTKIKSRSLLQREVLVFGLAYLWLSWIELLAKVYATPEYFDGTLKRNHSLLLDFSYTNNEQSRLLQFYIPELIHRISPLGVEECYALQRFLFVALAFMWFHLYLRKWFDARLSLCGVVLLAAIMPLTYVVVSDLQESAPLLLLTFLLGLWAIREHHKLLLAAVLLVGGLNNETMLILPLVYALYNYQSSNARHLLTLVRDVLLVSLPAVVAIGTIRYINWDRPHLGGAWHLGENLAGIFSWNLQYWGIFFVFGILWVYAFLRWRKKPLFLKRASLMIPFFIVVHLITGGITEIRDMLPLGFIVIPMALFYVYPNLFLEEEGAS